MERQFLSPPEPPVALAARLLGPACAALVRAEPAAGALQERIRAGARPEDAVLAEAHRASASNPEVAEEFVAFFLGDLLRLGRGSLRPDLKRFLDTDDLVQSVLGDLWTELCAVRFETRASFVALLARRLRWKALGNARHYRAGRRREDRRCEESVGELRVASDEPSPDTRAAQAEERERLIIALARLRPRDRWVLRRHFQGATLQELSAELGLAPRSAAMVLHRAIQRARDLQR